MPTIDDDDIKMAIAHTFELQHDEDFLHKNMHPEIANIAHTSELQHDEDFLRKNMHPEIANVYKGKSFLLLREMPSSVDWPDVKLSDDLVAGMPIRGEYPLPSSSPQTDENLRSPSSGSGPLRGGPRKLKR